MSDLNAIGLILATLLAGYVAIVYTAKTINKRADMIITGVVEGVPASKKYRNMMLNHMLLQFMGGLIGLAVILVVGAVRIADSVTDPGVKNLAYLAAALGAFAAGTWSILGTSFYIYCAGVVRQDKRD